LRVIQILTSPENQEDFDQNKRTIENQEEHKVNQGCEKLWSEFLVSDTTVPSREKNTERRIAFFISFKIGGKKCYTPLPVATLHF